MATTKSNESPDEDDTRALVYFTNEHTPASEKLLNEDGRTAVRTEHEQTNEQPERQETGQLPCQDSKDEEASKLIAAWSPPGESPLPAPQNIEVRTYKKRWLILLIFSLFSLGSAYQWIHMNIISNITLRFYNASLPEDSLEKATAVDWLSMIYFLSYVLAFIPVLWILESKGLRVSVLIGTTLNLAGTGLKVVAVNPNLFHVLLVGQTLCALAEVIVLPIPPRLAAVWFGANEVAIACSIGVLANQFGVAVGFLLPPVLVPDTTSVDDLTFHIRSMMIGGAVFSATVLLMAVFAFRDKPEHPPSSAQYLVEFRLAEAAKEGKQGLLHSLRLYRNSLLRLARNRNFIMLTISYGLNTGSFYALSTLLNNMVLWHHPGEQVSAGRIGLTIVFAGALASVLSGLWLDRTKTFKSTSVGIYILTALGMVAFTFTLNLDLWVIYLMAGSLGFFMTGFLPVAYQFAVEITYPESEGSSSGLLTGAAMLSGIIMTLGMRAMMDQVSVVSANLFVSCVLLLGTIITGAVQAKYRRQDAEESVLQKAVIIPMKER